MSDGGKAALCSGMGRGGPQPEVKSQQRARSCVSTGCAVGGAGLSPVPGTHQTPPSLLHGPIVPVPSFWLLSWDPCGPRGFPEQAEPGYQPVPCSLRVCLSLCPSVSLYTGYLRRAIQPSQPHCRVLPAQGAVPTHMCRVCAVTLCFGQEEKGKEPGKATACCLFCSYRLGEPCFHVLIFSCK